MDQVRGEWTDPTSESATVAEIASWWLQTVVPARARSDNTIEQYRIIVEYHLIPALGATPAIDLSPEQVEAWLAERKLLAASYLARIRSTLVQIFTQAERRAIVVVQRCRAGGPTTRQTAKGAPLAHASGGTSAARCGTWRAAGGDGHRGVGARAQARGKGGAAVA